MQTHGRFLDTLRSRLSLAEVVGEKVKLTRKGREFMGLCPFHHEKTPSFTVSEEKEFYHCFGCGAHGDAIRFLMEADKYTFVEAVKELASRTGLSLPQDFSRENFQESDQPQEDLSLLQEAIQEASCWFHKNLFLNKFGESLRYVERRKITRATTQKFVLGYAPEGRHNLETYLKEKGFSEEILLKAGLLAQGEENVTPYDRFRRRVIFSIHDTKGKIVAFGGRLLDKGEPKYLNSPETPLFSKGKLLYGYSFAREKAQADPLIIVEGYMDVIALHQAGYCGAVAPLGTALTEDQILLAWRLSPEPILCFDGDPAGLKAAARAAERVLPLLKPGHSLRFSFLPQGEDPDSLIQKGAAFQDVLTQASSLLETLWMFLTQGKAFKTPEQKTALQQRYTLWTKTIKNAEVQKSYNYAFRDLFFKKIIGKKAAEQSISPLKRSKLNLFHIQERLLLAILLNHPNLLDETSDDLTFIEFNEVRLHEMRDAILRFYSAGGPHKQSLSETLLHNGFEREVNEILSPHILIHGSFAKSSASLEEAREGWKEIFTRIQRTLGKNDLQMAQDHLADDMSPQAWERLKMLKKSTFVQD